MDRHRGDSPASGAGAKTYFDAKMGTARVKIDFLFTLMGQVASSGVKSGAVIKLSA